MSKNENLKLEDLNVVSFKTSVLKLLLGGIGDTDGCGGQSDGPMPPPVSEPCTRKC